LFEQFQARVLAIDKDSGNQAPVAINCVRQSLTSLPNTSSPMTGFGALTERPNGWPFSGASIKAIGSSSVA
jgi:hypothetical protein